MVQDKKNYQRIAQAIDFLDKNRNKQPSLQHLAQHLQISPSHLQRIFLDWAGVSPKQFSRFLNIEYAKQVLDQKPCSVLECAYETGLSSSSRLYDLFVSIEEMTPGEYKNQGCGLTINFSYANNHFGELIIASTAKGVCHLMFCSERDSAFNDLRERFPKANFEPRQDAFQRAALRVFDFDNRRIEDIKLHLKATPFQIKVWQALLCIPFAGLSSYASVAKAIEKQSASRAVGSAVACNSIAYIIPCHRVIKKTGLKGQYRWGATRKSAMLAWEAAHAYQNDDCNMDI